MKARKVKCISCDIHFFVEAFRKTHHIRYKCPICGSNTSTVIREETNIKEDQSK